MSIEVRCEHCGYWDRGGVVVSKSDQCKSLIKQMKGI